VGIVFQAFHLVGTMTARENVALPLEFAGRSQALETAGGGLDAVGLAERAGHYPAQLSGGEQQRVAIARAFAPSPHLLLADEPTGNLDQETSGPIMDKLFEMKRDMGATLLLITHDRQLSARCDRIIAMRNGRLIPEDS
jgi:putative ABC transport system ATP-binding protein